MKKKTVALLLALVLVIGCAIGGTIAWLVDTTDPVVNTFSSSNINIELTETANTLPDDNDSNDTTNSYQMVPGATITKDPKVTVKAGSEDCWLFVKLEKSANYDTYLANYAIAEGWAAVDGEAGVYYRKITGDAAKGTPYDILSNNQLTVLNTVTKEMMEAIDGIVVTTQEDGTTTTNTNDSTEIANRPTLTVTAYAIQSAHLTKQVNGEAVAITDAADAWAILNPPTNS